MATNDIPTYNLKAVVHETGLKPDTLRAWERRYGIPEPDRTAGGHRLYSQQDINTLKWLLDRQEEGLSISRAVRLWRRLINDGKDPLQVMPLARASEVPAAYTAVELGNSAVQLRKSWIEACLNFDERSAELIMSQAFSYYPPELVCLEVLQKALVEIGNGWYDGTVTVQQEHFASALALRRINMLVAALPAPTRSGRIIVGCPPGENHTFPALLVTFLLRRRGWDVIYLGANVPTGRLLQMIESTRPDLVVFSAQLLESAASLLDVAHYMQEQKLPLAYGGYIFSAVPDLQKRIPGHFLGNSMELVPQVVEQLITARPPTPGYETADSTYQKAYTAFMERHGQIESETWVTLDKAGFPKSEIPEANRHMSANIAAALKLGDLGYVEPNLMWLEGMLTNHEMPLQLLQTYLEAYVGATRNVLGDYATDSIGEWLDEMVDVAAAESTGK